MEQIYNLLDWEELPGNKEEKKILRTWMNELAMNKGEEWIRRHRFMLRDR